MTGIPVKVWLVLIASSFLASRLTESKPSNEDISYEEIQEVIDNILEIQKIVKRIEKYFYSIEDFVGKNEESGGGVDKKGIFNNFIFAYHVGYPATKLDWYTSYYHLKYDILRPLEFIRNRQLEFEQLRNYGNFCTTALKAYVNQLTDNIEDLVDCHRGPLVKKLGSGQFGEDLGQAYYYSVFVVVKTLFYALGYDYVPVGMEALHAEPSRVAVGVFKRMADEANIDMLEIKRRLVEFQKRIDATGNAEEKAKMEKQFNEIITELSSHPYDSVFVGGDERYNAAREDTAKQLFLDFSSTHAYSYATMGFGAWRQLGEQEFLPILESTKNFYESQLRVDEGSVNSSDWTLQSGWDWQYKVALNPNGVIGPHYIRISWEFLDRMLEKLKCVMKETYYFDLRNESLKRTQVDLSTAKLFTGISSTLKRPCRVTDETDLVGGCTRENHEVCTPMHFSSSLGQKPDHDTHGGISLLRPKYYFKRNAKDECVEMKAFVIPYKACHCGFRLDCGKDLGKNLVCHLQADYARKQCRGGVGYPCKTLPLVPGRYHESCVSGYCDVEENSCEDEPAPVNKPSGASGLEIGTYFAGGTLLASLWIRYVILK